MRRYNVSEDGSLSADKGITLLELSVLIEFTDLEFDQVVDLRVDDSITFDEITIERIE